MTQITINSTLAPSPMQAVNMSGHTIYIKRDDLLNEHFSGNKARKFYYYLCNDFPKVKKIVGYGSIQANSLYSLSALAKLKEWQLDYYVSYIPRWLKDNPNGNYRASLALGANIIEVDKISLANHKNLDQLMRVKSELFTCETLFIPEGGRSRQAKQGITILANEIIEFCNTQDISDAIIMLPSGTGTTALFLQSLLPFQVYTCACVGDNEYLRQQFSELETKEWQWPTVLPVSKKFHFGKLYPEFYDIWKRLYSETKIEFDLLYDPLGWLTLLSYLDNHEDTRPIIYIHQGGVIGNESMLPRYKRKYQ